MKSFSASLLILGIISSTNAWANDVCKRHLASLSCGQGSVEKIDFTGYVNIDGTTVVKSLNVVGNLTAHNANINNIRMLGNIELNQSTTTSEASITGNLSTQEVKILNSIDVYGNVEAKRSSFNAISKIVGTLECENCDFKDTVKIIGNFQASNTVFAKNILINSAKAKLYQSRTEDITVEKPTKNEEQVIELHDRTTVKNIYFESGRGLVIAEKNSKILGKVAGGKLITK